MSKYSKHYDEWTRLYIEEQMSTRQIAAEYGCGSATVHKALKRRGVTRPNYKYTQHHNEWIRLYTEEGWSSVQIAERYGASEATVWEFLSTRNLTRSVQEANSKYADAWDEWERLYVEEELPMMTIAERFDCAPDTVEFRLEKRGIEIRPASFYATDPEERFWSYVDKKTPDECWPWMGTLRPDGYGVLNIDQMTVRAHRISYKLHNGEIPDGSFICHRCDNRKCVNPHHLYAGNPQTNSDDAWERERHQRGEDRPNAKLTTEEVRTIRRRYVSEKITLQDLADEYEVSDSVIYHVANHKTWQHVE